MKTVGILALQGDFEAHARAVTRAGGQAVEVRKAADLEAIDGLIIPGGESTTMLKLLKEEKLFDPIREFGRKRRLERAGERPAPQRQRDALGAGMDIRPASGGFPGRVQRDARPAREPHDAQKPDFTARDPARDAGPAASGGSRG